MRVLVAAGLLAVGFQVCVARDLDNRAYSIINEMIVVNRLKGPVADRVCNALRNEAERYDSFENALIYVYEAHSLVKDASPNNEYLLLGMRADGQAKSWVHLANCGRRFKGEDGRLPQVRYKDLTADNRQWLEKWSSAWYDCMNIANEYGQWRDKGYKPRKAYQMAGTKGSDAAKNADEQLWEMFLDAGDWMFTGYDDKEAQKDLEAFLEARYVALPHSATDTSGVVPAFTPDGYMSQKLIRAVKNDEAHMLIRIQQVASRAMNDGGAPAKQPPLGGYNLNGNWVEKGTTHKFMIVHEGYKVSVIRMYAVYASPAGDVIFEANLSQKFEGGDYKSRGKCYPRIMVHGQRSTSPDWEWYTGGFEIQDNDRCFAEWLGGYTGVIDLVREK